MTRPGVYSHLNRVLRADGRTREGKLVARLRAELRAQFPCANVVQELAIERLAGVYLRLLLMDRRLAEHKEAHGRSDPLLAKAYVENNAAFMRLLGILGLDPTLPDAKPAPQPLDEYLRATADTWKPNGSANGAAGRRDGAA